MLKKIVCIGSIIFGFSLFISMATHKSESYLRDRVVRLVSSTNSCSGEQVRAPSGIDYILSAGHCRILEENGFITILKADGTTLQRRIIAEDPKSDLLLLEGLPALEGLSVARAFESGLHVRTFTHGHGYETYKTEGELIQLMELDVPLFIIDLEADITKCDVSKPKIIVKDMPMFIFKFKACVLHESVTVTTAMIVPGSSGGMVVDDSGDLVGVVSAGNEKFGFLATIADIRAFLAGY